MKPYDHTGSCALPKTLESLFPHTSTPQRALRSATGRSLRSMARRLLAGLRHLWQAMTLDDRAAYLGGAVDLADLERRIRAWEGADRKFW